MGSKVDIVLKLSVIGAVLLASSSVAYYYVLYLPRRDVQLDAQRAMEKAQVNEERRADRERELFNQRALEDRRTAEKATAQMRYQRCMTSAQNNYESSWAAACKRLGGTPEERQKTLRERADCMSKPQMSKSLCDAVNILRDNSPDCSLPRVIATDLETDLEKGRNRCLQENRAGLQ